MADRSAAYNEYFQNKMAQDAWDSEKQSYGNLNGVEDLSGPIGEGVVESGKTTPKQMAASPTQNPSGSSAMGNAGKAAAIAGTATANPYLMATGMALQTMGQIQEGKQQQRNAQYQAEVAKINARQNAIDRMAQIGAGLKA